MSGVESGLSSVPLPMKTSVSVVVPCYNSHASLPLLVERLEGVFRSEGREFEILLVEDGSSDTTWPVIQSLAASQPKVRPFKLLRNYGQHNALLCGIRNARFDYLVTIDDDLQNPPEEIPRLLAKLEEGYDVVYGTPQKQQHGVLRDLASTLTKITLQGVMGAETAGKVSAFRVMRTNVRSAFADYQSPLVSIDVLVTWGSSRFAAIPVRSDPRTIGQSNYTIGKLFAHAMNMMTGFSTLPLQFASFVGFSMALFGAGSLAWVLGRYLMQGSTVQGFAFLGSVISIFGGAQLCALGIIGEYLARIHLRTMDRPCYTVDQSMKHGGEQ
jgi:undecaprenyl-phosphate 4-deoxy-4-formamido-L-arabinose transferase